MADKIEFPEDIDKWFKGKIKEGVGTGHEHCDDFYRFKDYGIEHDSDGSWEAYTIIDEKPILAKKGLGSFGEAVEYFKHELSKKELADAEDCEIEEEHPDAPSFPEQDTGGMKLEIFFKSTEEMLGEYEQFSKIDFRNNLTHANKPAAQQTRKFIQDMVQGKPVDRSGVAAVTNGGIYTGNPTSRRTYAGAVTLKGMGEDYGSWPQYLNKINKNLRGDKLYPADGEYYFGDDVANLPLDELRNRIFQMMDPEKASVDKRYVTNDARRSPFIEGLMPEIKDGKYTGRAMSLYEVAKNKNKEILKHKDTGADLHTFRPSFVLYKAPNSAKLVDKNAKPQYEPHNVVSANMDDEEYYNTYRSPDKWINDRETALNTLLAVPIFRNALREYDNLRKEYIAARNRAKEKNPDKNIAPPKKLNDAYEKMQGIADRWLKRYVGGGTYVDIMNGNNAVTRGDKTYTVPIWYLPPYLEDISYRKMEEVPDKNNPSNKVWANGDYRFAPDAVEWRDNRNFDIDVPDELYADDPRYLASNYRYPYLDNHDGIDDYLKMALNNLDAKNTLEERRNEYRKRFGAKDTRDPLEQAIDRIDHNPKYSYILQRVHNVISDYGFDENDPLSEALSLMIENAGVDLNDENIVEGINALFEGRKPNFTQSNSVMQTPPIIQEPSVNEPPVEVEATAETPVEANDSEVSEAPVVPIMPSETDTEDKKPKGNGKGKGKRKGVGKTSQRNLDSFIDNNVTPGEGETPGAPAETNDANNPTTPFKESGSKSAADIMQEWSDNGTHLIREPWKVIVLDAGSKESDPLTFRDDTGNILFNLRHI